jgi:hypothetical protein
LGVGTGRDPLDGSGHCVSAPVYQKRYNKQLMQVISHYLVQSIEYVTVLTSQNLVNRKGVKFLLSAQTEFASSLLPLRNIKGS